MRDKTYFSMLCLYKRYAKALSLLPMDWEKNELGKIKQIINSRQRFATPTKTFSKNTKRRLKNNLKRD